MIVSGSSAGFVEEPWLGTTVRCYADRPRTIVELLDRAVRSHPEAVAVESPDGASVTYAELAELVEGAAARILEEGLQPGDSLAVALPNGLAAIVAIWACARAGVLCVGIPTKLAPAQWTYVLQHSSPALVLADEQFLTGVRQAADDAGLDARQVRALGDLLLGRRLPWRGEELPFPDEAATYAVVYSSGTTGRPKAIAMVHKGCVHSAIAYVRTFGLVAGDRTAITFPMYYTTGHVAQVAPMMLVGGTSVPITELGASDVVRVLRDRRITYVMVTPSLWPLLLRDPGFRWPDLAALRVGAFGGAPVSLTTLTALRERMPQLRLYDAYGLSETHSPATILLDSEMARKPGSIGRPVPCADVRIVDDNGHDLPTGTPGELLVRGPMITTGYVGDPEATAAAIVDGWLRTGDLCRVDEEGFVFLLDRLKDVVIRGGYKIYSVELEHLLVSHPAVEQAAVFGIPDTLAFESVAAYLVLAPGAAPTTTDIRMFVRNTMADYAVPQHIRFVEAIPRNKTGKTEKRLLRELLTAELAAVRGRRGQAASAVPTSPEPPADRP